MSLPFKKGDVLVFKGEGDWLSKAITWLTDSDVTHAAMVYGDDTIVEMTGYGIAEDKVTVTEGNDACVLRLAEEREPAPLLAAAELYLKGKIPYDYSGLLMLGGLLLIRKITPSSSLFSIINRILKKCCKALDIYIQEVLLHRPNKAMVCSELVYQIYCDCGKNYYIEIHNGTFSDSCPGSAHPEAIRLIDFAAGADADAFQLSELQDETDPAVSDDELRELLEALSEAEALTETSLVFEEDLLAKAKNWAGSFLSRLKKLRKVSGSDIPLDAFFVTPADLAYHAVNLKNVGSLSLERKKK